VGVVALRLGPGPAEIEARLLRRHACQALVSTAAWPMIALRALRLLRQR